MEKTLKHYRITLLINGIIAILFSSLALFLPVTTIKTLVVYFGILLLLGGIGGIIVSIQNMKGNKPYISALVSSIVSVVMAIIIIFNTRLSLEIFAIIFGIWALVIGAVQLFIALKLLEPGTNRKLLVSNSVATLIFGLLLFLNPFGSIVALVYIVGALALLVGGILLFFSFSIRSAETE